MPDQLLAMPLSKEQIREATAMVECLAYLEDVAGKAGFSLVAHMIGLARQSTNELLAGGSQDPQSSPIEIKPIGSWPN